MKIDVFDQTGKKVDELTLNAKIFEALVQPALVAQAVRVRLINARTGTASTKTRAEVSGGGRKPWRQKGTGRARQGSIRAPQWKGGGIVHGPQPGRPEARMPRAMRRAALFSALTEKAHNKGVVVVDGLTLAEPKTKLMAQVVAALPVGRTVLVILPEKQEVIERSTKNLLGVKTMTARVLHPYDVLQYQTVVFLKDSLQALEETFLSEHKKQEVRSKKRAEDGKRAEGRRQKAETGSGKPATRSRRSAQLKEEAPVVGTEPETRDAKPAVEGEEK